MQIVCNGEKREISQGLTVGEYICQIGFNPDSVVTECDGRILKREEYETVILTDGAVLELIRFVGGG